MKSPTLIINITSLHYFYSSILKLYVFFFFFILYYFNEQIVRIKQQDYSCNIKRPKIGMK